MPWVGVRQRAAVVVCLVTLVLAAMALAPAGAQLITLPPNSTTASVDQSTTTVAESTSTTASSGSTTSVRSSTPTTSGTESGASRTSTTTTASGSGGRAPSSTVRRTPTTTSSGPSGGQAPTTSSSLQPTTTEARGVIDGGSTTTTDTLAIERAASASGMSTGSLVALIVAGLLGVALALSALTVRYVRATRPHDHFIA